MGTPMVTIPMGTTVIERKEYEFIRDERAQMSSKINTIKDYVVSTWIHDKGKGFTNPSIYCDELAILLGIKLPDVESEGKEKKDE